MSGEVEVGLSRHHVIHHNNRLKVLVTTTTITITISSEWDVHPNQQHPIPGLHTVDQVIIQA